jgi:hypothetical protein
MESYFIACFIVGTLKTQFNCRLENRCISDSFIMQAIRIVIAVAEGILSEEAVSVGTAVARRIIV